MSKPEGTSKPEASAPSAPVSKAKGHNPLPDGCHGWGCKAKAHKFNFCDEHFDQFKFGLVKKTGEQVSDYEKKFEHYMRHKERLSARKTA
jgi:hypothetical protein